MSKTRIEIRKYHKNVTRKRDANLKISIQGKQKKKGALKKQKI